MSAQLNRNDLLSLEDYDQQRESFKKRIAAEKMHRRIKIGPDVMMHFENKFIMQYQVQEMLRAEKIFDETGIQDELDVYNDLIPDGSNFKATMMIEYVDPEERGRQLGLLIGIERKTWVRIAEHDKVYAIANEDLERETAEKTSSVHFMRFELTPAMVQDAKNGAGVTIGIDHPKYSFETKLQSEQASSLIVDLA